METNLHALHIVSHDLQFHLQLYDFVLTGVRLHQGLFKVVLHHVELPGHLLVLPLRISGQILRLLAVINYFPDLPMISTPSILLPIFK